MEATQEETNIMKSESQHNADRQHRPGIILTVGHSTKTMEEFIQLLKFQGVTKLVDVRAIPRSRTNPPFNSETLPSALDARGIGYLHMAGLGGLRHSRSDTLNRGWLNTTFMGFADYMRTPEFEENIDSLIELARTDSPAMMCAEAAPWHCHRSLIADALLVRGVRVEHIINHSPRRVHVLTPWAMVNGTRVTYPIQALANDPSRQLIGV